MDAALASLFGAVIGGSIAAGSNFGLEGIRNNRERARTAAQGRSQARRAARLLAEELESGRRLLVRDIETGVHGWEPPERQLPSAAWTAYRTDFAEIAPPDAWHDVASAYAQFDELNWHVVAVVQEDHWTGGGPQHPIERREMGPRSTELFNNTLMTVDRSLALLHDLMS
jgi:hypothetical protein